MRIFLRLVIVAALSYLGLVLFWDARAYQANEDADQTKLVLYFVGVVFTGVAVGGIVALSLIPLVGEQIGSFFFNPGQQIEKDPHAPAVSKIAAGDYEGAIEEYRNVLEDNPSDTMAISEIARFYCDKLENSAAAAEVLEEALQREWGADDSAFLCNRLVDVYWTYMHDGVRAHALLVQIAENLPDTKYAANALHRMREIDRAIETGEMPKRTIASAE